jgi:hypothetical protein
MNMEKKIEKKEKVYQKPRWEKQQLFERFVMACTYKSCFSTRPGLVS